MADAAPAVPIESDDGDETKVDPAFATRTAAHFLISCPADRVDEAVKELNTILPADSLVGADRAKVFLKLNTMNMVSVKAPYGDHRVVLCNEAVQDATHVLDSIACKIVAIDHEKREFVSDPEDTAFEQANEPHRAAIVTALAPYVSKFYGATGAYGAFHGPDGKLVVVISGHVANARNQWSGSWRSKWSISIEEGSVAVAGKVSFAAQYSEFGNVQVQNQFMAEPQSAPFTDSASLASAVGRAIMVAESNLQTAMHGTFVEVASATLKGVRRRLPINGQKMNWNVKTHRMSRHFAGKPL